MTKLERTFSELLQRKITRQQFLVGLVGAVLGTVGIFRVFEYLINPAMKGEADTNAFGSKNFGGVKDKVERRQN